MARGHDDSCYLCRQVEEECARLRAHVDRLTAALQALADAADARLHEPNWMPLLNARRVLAAAEKVLP